MYGRLLPFLGILSFFLLSCAAPKELVYRDTRNVSIGKLGFSSSDVSMELVYFNPNNFGLQLAQTELDIFINGHFLGHTYQQYQVNIPRNGEFSIPIKISVDMKNLLKNGVLTFFSKEVTVKVTGRIKVGKAGAYMGFPVNYEGKQQLSIL